jgi:hypothetical protein
LTSVEGRVDDAIVRPDGAIVTAGAIDRAIGRVTGVSVWQCNQTTPERVEFDVVTDGDAARTAADVRAAVLPLLEGLDVTARSAAAIPIEPSGKFRVSKRHFPIDLGKCFVGA